MTTCAKRTTSERQASGEDRHKECRASARSQASPLPSPTVDRRSSDSKQPICGPQFQPTESARTAENQPTTKMFKSVTRALKMSSQLQRDEAKAEQKEKRTSKIWRSKSADSADSLDPSKSEVTPAPTKGEAFLVRHSKKKLSKMVARLQQVRSLSAHIKQHDAPAKLKGLMKGHAGDSNKTALSKVVKFKLSNDKEGIDRNSEKGAAAGRNSLDCYDSDEDDAYVSASSTFGDEHEHENQDERDGAGASDNLYEDSLEAGDQTDPLTRSRSEDELAGDKLILPEELCDIPTFLHTQNSPSDIIEETRRLLQERFARNPDSFYECDYKRMMADDWTVTRFLLRRRQDPKRTAKLMEECGKFRRLYKMGEVKLWEFPIEFHLAGGLFKYAPDLVGNQTMYMRIKMYRRVPEISDVFKAFILCVLEECDIESNGRGTAVVFDMTGCSLQNVDLGFLYWLLNSFRNYCPKGVSYIIVYNLPWFLSATAKLAMSWMSDTNRRSLRFAHGREIENFIARENLPDYLGGTCPIDYRAIPAGSRPAVEVCHRLDISPEQALKIRELFKEYLPNDYDIPTVAAKEEEEDGKNDESGVSSGGESGDSDSNLTDGAPVADLVSNASKFMAAN